MPPPSNIKGVVPPDHLTSVAAGGFAAGVLRFGTISMLSHFLLLRHPVYRGLTIQFKVYLQLSAIILGGCIFAEKRVSEYNDAVRNRNRALERSRRVWTEEQEFKERLSRREAPEK